MKCNRCKVEKQVSDFSEGNKKCKDCQKYCDSYYKKNRKASIERATRSQNKDREKTNAYKRDLIRKNPVNYMFCQVKSRSKKLGIEFNLDKEDIQIPEYCPILGIKLEIGKENCWSNSPTLDRINPNKGYVKGNIHVISHKANTIKSDASLSELKKVVLYLEKITQ